MNTIQRQRRYIMIFFVRLSTNIFKKYPFESKKENVFYIPLFLKLS